MNELNELIEKIEALPMGNLDDIYDKFRREDNGGIFNVAELQISTCDLKSLSNALTLANKKIELLQASNDHYADANRWTICGSDPVDLCHYGPTDDDPFELTHGPDFARKTQEQIARLTEGENG